MSVQRKEGARCARGQRAVMDMYQRRCSGPAQSIASTGSYLSCWAFKGNDRWVFPAFSRITVAGLGDLSTLGDIRSGINTTS